MKKKQDKVDQKRGNKLFREGFKMRYMEDMKVVDKHFQALCEFGNDVSVKIGHPVSVLTPVGTVSFTPHENPMIGTFTLAYKRVKGKGHPIWQRQAAGGRRREVSGGSQEEPVG